MPFQQHKHLDEGRVTPVSGCVNFSERAIRAIRRAIRAQEGQAIVELALVLPILLVVLFGIFDFGQAISNWNSETALANVGARYAAVGNVPTTTQDSTCGESGATSSIVTYVQCQAQHDYQLPTGSSTYGLQGPVSVAVCAPSGTAVGDPVKVVVSAKYNWLPVGKLLGLSLGQTTVSADATMRIEAVGSGSNWTFSTTPC